MLRPLLIGLVALILSACATAQRYDAAQDVHNLLVAIRDNDRAAFDRHVDRQSLKRQLEGRLIDEAQESGAPRLLQGLGITLAEPMAELAGELLIQPRVFRWVAEHYGYRRTDPLPSAVAISPALRPIGGGRVCAIAESGGPCVLVFTRIDGLWKLTGFEGDLSLLRARL